METNFKLGKFSMYLDLDFTPQEVATLSLTLEYRIEEYIRKIEESRKDLKEYPNLAETIVDNIRYFEREIQNIESIFNKLNIGNDENK
jgi:hypothetical protein